MKKCKLAVASEEVLDNYRNDFLELLEDVLNADILDLNTHSNWETLEDLASNCIDAIISGSMDFVILLSITGNTFQILTNKNELIRAAPIPNMEYVEEASKFDPNMCEINTYSQGPRSACDIVIQLLHLLGICRAIN